MEINFSIPQQALMPILRTMMEEQGAVAFQNTAGTSTDTFLELLGAYLESTILCYEGDYFIQSSGVCIGSGVAPYLSDAFMVACDRKVRDSLEDERVLAVVRYVDDVLVLCSTNVSDQSDDSKDGVLRPFQESCGSLVFTHDFPLERSIRFLDLTLEFRPAHVCWQYETRSSKGFLLHESAHSKNVKRGLVFTARSEVLPFRSPLTTRCA